MRFDVLTLFPDMVERVLKESITGRALEKGLFDCHFINIRDYSKDKHKRVDDYPYGGGMGLVMSPVPIYDAYQSICNQDVKPYTIYLSPQGRVLNQQVVCELAKKEHIVLLCGHYEGVDERLMEEIVDEEISIGDYVLTGGEIPAMVLIDSVARLLPGVLACEEAYSGESHYCGLLEYPQYTRPPEFLGRAVPGVLLSGHHKNIEKWRRAQSVARTYIKRPDMLSGAILSKEDENTLQQLRRRRRKGLKKKTVLQIDELL